jgi:hypothetical protein
MRGEYGQRRRWGLTLVVAMLGLVAVVVRPAPAEVPEPITLHFTDAAPQGFGDRQNSGGWSSAWWQGRLYVGTVRSWFCFSDAWFHFNFPIFPYPADDPDLDCAPDPTDLPLQAELWRWTPETDTWERVYQSPRDVPIPIQPSKLTARDIGWRSMAVFSEPDETEALYVGGVTSNLLWPPMPPPRILRSTDGVTFEPIPQDPGTLLGDLGQQQTSFRSMQVYKGRLYVLNGAIRGNGRVLEAADPAGGNDNFRWVTPVGMQVYEMAVFNGYLYLGLLDQQNGYSVVKTDATGTPPYTFTTVVPSGAFVSFFPSTAAVSMHVFNDRLYVGTANPVELIRINPDDTWDLLVGRPRLTPQGLKAPLSGLGEAFNWPPNRHIWRMEEYAGALYVATYDESRQFGSRIPPLDRRWRWNYGFDLYRTSDGFHFRPLTVNGFGDPFQSGVRTFSATPHGLFLGTVSLWHGLRILQGVPATPVVEPPERVEVEQQGDNVLLSWDPPRDRQPVRYRIFRSDIGANSNASAGLTSDEAAGDPDVAARAPAASLVGFASPFQEVGSTTQLFFSDVHPAPLQRSQYYVIAENPVGAQSAASNLAEISLLSERMTFRRLEFALMEWAGRSSPLIRPLQTAGRLARSRAWIASLLQLKSLGGRANLLVPWRADDFTIMLRQLERRVRLAQIGRISPGDL